MTSNNNEKMIVVAFDIETTGCSFEKNNVVGIGMSAMNENFEEIDSLLLKGYVPDQVVFEKRCQDEFWNDKADLLALLKYDGPLKELKDINAWMTEEFQKFRLKHEQNASDIGAEHYLVCDNSAFDAAFMSSMIDKYGEEDDMPLPYSNLTGQYEILFETHSMEKGLLLGTDPEFYEHESWGLTKRIKQTYDLPPLKKEADHNPANDAYTIAHQFLALMNIGVKKIKKRKIETI